MLGDIVHNARDAIALVLLFSFTIFVHEFGHFLAALRCGMVIDTFSIGFGPALWKRKIRGVTYKIGCIPVGGYVALPQLDPAAMDAVQGGKPAKNDGSGPRELPPISPLKKILVSVAGPAGNVLLAVGLAWVIYVAPSKGEPRDGANLVGFVATNSAAYASGLRPGDRILAVDGESVMSWGDFSTVCYLKSGNTNGAMLSVQTPEGVAKVAVSLAEGGFGADGVERAMACVVTEVLAGGSAQASGVRNGDMIRTVDGITVASTLHFVDLISSRGEETVSLELERDGKTVKLHVVPKHDEELGRAVIGAMVSTAIGRATMPWMVHKEPLAQLKGDAMGIVRILRALVTPRETKQAAKGLGGPVLILATLWVSIKVSILNAVGFLRFLNVNLAILNLLPVPVLDGGHIMFSLWEVITRRRAHPRLVNVLVNAFAAALILVFLLLTFRDVRRLPRIIRVFRDSANVEELTEDSETRGGESKE